MKLLSIAVPSYNSEAYLENCLRSLVSAGTTDIEILVVNDGSRDGTGAIADRWQEAYPGTVRAIHQENGGHGEAVNVGLRQAQGRYFKVVDSDDWLDTGALGRLLGLLRDLGSADPVSLPDLVVTNFVYEKVGAKKKRVMHYRGVFPSDRVVTWEQTKPLGLGRYLMMHSLLYRTEVLRASGLVLPKHTFYVDNLYVYVPLEHVRTVYYLDVDLYRYFIGRSDQSVNQSVMLKRLEQQIRVNTLVVRHQRLETLANPKVRELKFHQLEIITAITQILLILSGTDRDRRTVDALWATIQEHDVELHHRLKKGLLARILSLKGPLEWVPVLGYRWAQRFFGFN